MNRSKIVRLLLLVVIFPLGLSAEWTIRGGLLFDFPADFSGRGSTVAKTVVERGVGYDLAIGYDLPLFRIEAEAVFLKNNIGGIDGDYGTAVGNLKRTTIFANAYLDIPFLPYVNGYIGAGVGMAKASLDFTAEDESGYLDAYEFSDGATVFGGQLMAGIRVELADRLSANLGYRYYVYQDTALSDRSISLDSDSGDEAFEASVGLKF